MRQGRGARNHIIYFSKDGKIQPKQSACNFARAKLQLVTTNPPRLHTLPEKLNAVSENKHMEIEDFPMGSTCGKILMYIRGAKSGLVWSDAASIPLTSFFCRSMFMWQRWHRQWGASSHRKFWAKLLHFIRSNPCPKLNICFSGMLLHSLHINHAGRDDLAGDKFHQRPRYHLSLLFNVTVGF